MSLKNRGKEPSDDKLFGSQVMQLKLKDAVEDLSHLLTRGYAERSSVLLVGNRYKLTARQQRAILGMGASKQQVEHRTKNSLSASELKDKEVVLDGFNVLILLESLLSGAYIFKGVDGFYRDLSSVHGSYKKVLQTARAIELIVDFYVKEGIRKMTWYFDKPVSNSGKLKKIIEEIAAEKGYDWKVFLTFATDKDIVAEEKIVISSDAWILDHVTANFNLIGYFSENREDANVVSSF